MRTRTFRDTTSQFDFESIAAGFLIGWLPVAEEGYEVRPLKVDRYGTGSLSDGLAIVPMGNWEKSYPVMTAGKARGLHRKFAKLALSKNGLDSQGVVAFANRFGLLEGTYFGMEEVHHSGSIQPVFQPIRSRADDFWHWIHLPDDMAAYIQLWDLVRNRDRAKLERFVRNEGGHLTFYYGWDGDRLNTNPSFFNRSRSQTSQSSDKRMLWESVVPAEIVREFPRLQDKSTRAIEITRLFLYQKINEGLSGRVSLSLTGYRPPESALVAQPKNLLGAIWLHFAREVMGEGTGIMFCANPICRRPTPFRRGKKFCSDVCRATMSRSMRQTDRVKESGSLSEKITATHSASN